MKDNYNIEDTAKLMTMSSGKMNKKTVILIVIAILAVIVVALVGFKMISDKKYDDQIAIADKALQEGNYEQAETGYLAAVKMNGRKPKAREGLAYVYALEGKTDQSVETYEELFKDTGEEKYKLASETVKDGGIPYDPEITPAPGLWRDLSADMVPFRSALIDFLYCFNCDTWEEFDNENPGDNQILGTIMAGFGQYHVAVEDLGADPSGEYALGETIDGLDPKGWGEDGAYDLYGSYGKYDIEKVNWVAENVFNLSEETIAAMQKKGETDRVFYLQDDSYICVDGWPTGAYDGEALEITGVKTDGQKFCIEYDFGIADYGYDYENFEELAGDYENTPVDRNEEYTTYYAVVEPKLIDGKHYWSIYYNRTSMPDYIDEAATPEKDDKTDSNGGDSAANSVFGQLSGYMFYFSIGAGGWETDLTINPDGTFEGYYSDSDMGETGDDYPNGTRHECTFSGKFTSPEKVDEYTYRFTVEDLICAEEPGKESIEDGIRVIQAEPYGAAMGDAVELYLPGKSASDLPAAFTDWVQKAASEDDYIPEAKVPGMMIGECVFRGYKE